MKTPKMSIANTPRGQHTPTPWITENLNPFILGPDENAVCQMTWGKRPMAEEKANAAFIVRAVNAHEELLGELKANHALVDPDCEGDCATAKAIARAEGKE